MPSSKSEKRSWRKNLPILPGFSTHVTGSPSDLVFPLDHQSHAVYTLRKPDFRTGLPSERLHANLVLLFRLVLFYIERSRADDFWGWVQNDWGLLGRKKATLPGLVRGVVEFYVKARERWRDARGEGHEDLLTRLVDRWVVSSKVVWFADARSTEEWADRREAWGRMRDTRFEMLMSPDTPLMLDGEGVGDTTESLLKAKDHSVEKALQPSKPKKSKKTKQPKKTKEHRTGSQREASQENTPTRVVVDLTHSPGKSLHDTPSRRGLKKRRLPFLETPSPPSRKRARHLGSPHLGELNGVSENWQPRDTGAEDARDGHVGGLSPESSLFIGPAATPRNAAPGQHEQKGMNGPNSSSPGPPLWVTPMSKQNNISLRGQRLFGTERDNRQDEPGQHLRPDKPFDTRVLTPDRLRRNRASPRRGSGHSRASPPQRVYTWVPQLADSELRGQHPSPSQRGRQQHDANKTGQGKHTVPTNHLGKILQETRARLSEGQSSLASRLQAETQESRPSTQGNGPADSAVTARDRRAYESRIDALERRVAGMEATEKSRADEASRAQATARFLCGVHGTMMESLQGVLGMLATLDAESSAGQGRDADHVRRLARLEAEVEWVRRQMGASGSGRGW